MVNIDKCGDQAGDRPAGAEATDPAKKAVRTVQTTQTHGAPQSPGMPSAHALHTQSPGAAKARKGRSEDRIAPQDRPFIRAENEDDDGYDPYSDRQPHPEPLFERDPWD